MTTFDQPSAIHFVRSAHKHYRVTCAYSIVGVDRKMVRPYKNKVAVEVPGDPCFVVKVACAFCNTQEDVFTRAEGRRIALEAWNEGATEVVPVHIGQPILRAIELGLGRLDGTTLQRMHVPSNLHSYYHGLVHRPRITNDMLERRDMRRRRSMESRQEHRDCIARGLTQEAAVAELREVFGKHRP